VDIHNTIETLLKDGLILVFNQDKLDVVKTAKALIEAGVNNMEVTCRVSRPLEKLSRLRNELPDFVAGAASLIDFPEMLDVYNGDHRDDPLPGLQQVAEAGAGFLVSAANFSDESYRRFAGKLAMIPGCGSVTEVVSQFSKGASFCKIFPAKQLGGPAYVKAIDPAIHKTISLVPTGGTNADNIPDYINAGVLVVGGSFSMIDGDPQTRTTAFGDPDKSVMNKIIDEQDYDLLADRLSKIKELIDKSRSEKWPNIDFASVSVEQVSKVTGRSFNLL
jgi:2-dehydro-3-deoxyphosphogluconate aldolase/(4S)-4-hydroxy-2-oxoglutarate aldolase